MGAAPRARWGQPGDGHGALVLVPWSLQWEMGNGKMGNGKWLGPALLLELWSSNTSSELCRPQRLGFPYLGTWGPSGGTRHRSHPTDRPRPMHARCPNPFYFLVLLAASPLFSVSPLPLTRSSFAFLMPCWLFFALHPHVRRGEGRWPRCRGG